MHPVSYLCWPQHRTSEQGAGRAQLRWKGDVQSPGSPASTGTHFLVARSRVLGARRRACPHQCWAPFPREGWKEKRGAFATFKDNMQNLRQKCTKGKGFCLPAISWKFVLFFFRALEINEFQFSDHSLTPHQPPFSDQGRRLTFSVPCSWK